MRSRPRTPAQLEQDCERFNGAYRVGDRVRYFHAVPGPGRDGTPPRIVTIAGEAFVDLGRPSQTLTGRLDAVVHVADADEVLDVVPIANIFPAGKED